MTQTPTSPFLGRGDIFSLTNCVWVMSLAEVDRLVGFMGDAEEIIMDLETTGLDEHAIRGGTTNGGVPAEIVLAAITMPLKGGNRLPTTWIVPLSHPDSPLLGHWREALRRIAQGMVDNEVPFSNANIKFDSRWVYAHTLVDLAPLIDWDTQISSHLLDENASTKLKVRVAETFGIERWDDFDLSTPGAAKRVPLIQLGEYAAQDTFNAWRLKGNHQLRMNVGPSAEDIPPESPEEAEDFRLGALSVWCAMPTVKSLTRMEQRGIGVDREWIAAKIEEQEGIEKDSKEKLANRYPEIDGSKASFAPTSIWFREWAAAAVTAGDLRVAATTNSGNPQWTKGVLRRQARTGSEVAGELLRYRAASKTLEFLNSWLDVIAPDGRIYANYNAGRVHTGRLSSDTPNMQQVSSSLKAAFIPTPGYVFVDLDFSQIELRVAAFISRSEPMIKAYQEGQDLHKIMASNVTGKPISEVTKQERQQGKACIAEGQLVTTDKGLVPIEEVTTDHLVWDGIEWVQHEGVVYQGYREVITYDGLTATPDHIVFLEDGSTVCLGYAQTRGKLLAGADENGPCPVPDDQRTHHIHWSSPDGGSYLHLMRDCHDEACLEHPEGSRTGVQVSAEREVSRPESQGSGGALRRDGATVQEGDLHLEELRGSGDRAEVRESGTLHHVDAGEPSSRGLQEGGHRPEGQQRALRAGEPSTDLPSGEPHESAAQRFCVVHGYGHCPTTRMARDEASAPRVGVRPGDSPALSHEGNDSGGDSRKEEGSWARVYDLTHAGPRHRFTVSNKVISQCNFGLLFGLSAEGFQTYADDVYGVPMTLEEAHLSRAAFFDTWVGIAEWHAAVVARAGRYGQVVSPIGRIRRLPHIFDGNERLRSEAERQAINSPVQGFASDLMQMSLASIQGFIPGIPAVPDAHPVATVHDSILVEVPEDNWEELAKECQRRMVQVADLLPRMGCNFDVPLEADGGVGTRWGLNDLGEL